MEVNGGVVGDAPSRPAPHTQAGWGLESDKAVRIGIEIGLDGSLAPETDTTLLAKRLAMLSAEEQTFQLQPSYSCVDRIEPNDDGSRPDLMDSFELAQFKHHLYVRGAYIVNAIQLLFSQDAKAAWSHLLTNMTAWVATLDGLMRIFKGVHVGGVKLDLWLRSDSAIGAIYLSQDELTGVLAGLGIAVPRQLTDLAGVPWDDASNLPDAVNASRTIPRIAYEMTKTRYVVEARGLALHGWSIGLG